MKFENAIWLPHQFDKQRIWNLVFNEYAEKLETAKSAFEAAEAERRAIANEVYKKEKAIEDEQERIRREKTLARWAAEGHFPVK